MEFRILGTLEVSDGDTVLAVGGVKQRALLAVLLVRHGENVSAERLGTDLWGDHSPAGAANALQSLVSKLRRALGPAGRLLVTGPNGYRLAVEPDQLDAVRFATTVDRARRCLDEGDAAHASALLGEALELWRGPALDGLGDEGILRDEAMRLEELRLTATEDRFDADLRMGRDAELVAPLVAATAAHPLRERLHGFLMLALYRSGRQAEALRAYHVARTVLGEELGLEPGAELRALESAVLSQDPALLVRRERVPLERSRTNLVSPLSSFIGRVDELASLTSATADHRLVTLVGPGGAGKTRLAIEAARRHEGGDVWMVELAALRDPAGVPDAIASVLGVTGLVAGPDADAHAHVAMAADRTTPAVVEQLAPTTALLILDNCEHVVAGAAATAEHLLRSCAGLRILATSREALGIGGERIWPVPPLAEGDAIALFVDRASATGGFAPSEASAPAVRDLCHRLDGLPLAIELAAGRVRAIPVNQLAHRLDDRFRILTGGARTALPRQQTLRAVVEWSYDLLFDDQQRVFERLSVFAGGCSLEAAEAVCSGDGIAVGDMADLLAHLVDKSLVQADHASGEVRFRLLQTLALYGRERLAATSDALATRQRHAAFFRSLCDRGLEAFRGADELAWLTEVRRETDNVRAALQWYLDQEDAESAQQMMAGLGWTFWFSGRAVEGWQWFEAALGCRGTSSASIRSRAAMWAAYVGSSAGTGLQAALAYGEEALALARGLDDDGLIADACTLLGGIHLGAGRRDVAISLLEEAATRHGALGTPFALALGLNTAGRAAALRGDLADGERLQRQSFAAFQAAGAEWATAVIGGDLALTAQQRGDTATALATAAQARDAARRLELRGADAQLTARMGNMAMVLGDLVQAEQLHTEALDLAHEVGYQPATAVALVGRAIARTWTGNLDEAHRCATRAAEICRPWGYASAHIQALAVLGHVAGRRGDVAGAEDLHRQALAVALRADDRHGLVFALDGLATVASLAGDGRRAAQLLGLSQQSRSSLTDRSMWPVTDTGPLADALTTQLGQSVFEEAFGEGRAMTVESLGSRSSRSPHRSDTTRSTS